VAIFQGMIFPKNVLGVCSRWLHY